MSGSGLLVVRECQERLLSIEYNVNMSVYASRFRTFGSDAEERELSMTITVEAACLPGISKQFHVCEYSFCFNPDYGIRRVHTRGDMPTTIFG